MGKKKKKEATTTKKRFAKPSASLIPILPSLIPVLHWQAGWCYFVLRHIIQALNQEWNLNHFFLLCSAMTSVCFVIKGRCESLIQRGEARASLFYNNNKTTTTKDVFLERDREICTQSEVLWLAHVTTVPAHPEKLLFMPLCKTVIHPLCGELFWSNTSSLLLWFTHSTRDTQGSHNELFRVIKKYSKYYCLTLKFLGEKNKTRKFMVYRKKNFGTS